MLFRLTFLVFVFSIILTTAVKTDDSNSGPNSNSNVVIITVPLIIAADNSNLNSNSVAPVDVTKSTLKNSNLTPNLGPNPKFNFNPAVNKKNYLLDVCYPLVVHKAYKKLEIRHNKRNKTEKQIPSKRIKGQ